MDKRGVASIALIVLIVVLVGAVSYVVFVQQSREPKTTEQQVKPSPTQQTQKPVGNRSSPDELKTYTLDVSNITSLDPRTPTGTGIFGLGKFIVAPNEVVVFPLDLESQNKKITQIGPTTIFEAQTKSGCWGGNQILADDHHVVRSINATYGPFTTRDVGNVTKITLEMPYHILRNGSVTPPGTFCVGFHTSGNKWVWNMEPIRPILDDNLKRGIGEATLDAWNVNGIAILFDDTTVIQTITFEAAKVQ